jgi:hypothetical protein
METIMPAIKPKNGKILQELNEERELVPQRVDVMIDCIHRLAHSGDNEYWLRLQDVFLDFLAEQVYFNGEEVSINNEPHYGYEEYEEGDAEFDCIYGLPFEKGQKNFCLHFRIKSPCPNPN